LTTAIPRPQFDANLLARVEAGPPLLIAGPPGCGKTTHLAAVADGLRAAGGLVLELDLLLAASSPEGLVHAVLGALPEVCFREPTHEGALGALRDAGRADAARAVSILFELFQKLTHADGKPVSLLFDEATEIRSLTTFPGLRDVGVAFGRALQTRTRGALIATSFPTRARRLWSGDTLEIPPLSEDELRPRAGSEAAALLRASGGSPRYAASLLASVERGVRVQDAWATEIAPGGALDGACREVYETLLLRSRGYAMSKSVIAAVAREEGLNLTALCARVGRSPGAVRDYLGWLLDVDAVRTDRKRYFVTDPTLRDWLCLYSAGNRPSRTAIAAASSDIFGPSESPPACKTPPPRHDSLMEID